ncbi:MAG: alpha-amylase family glycosyl hydrolase [Chloroflexota bacterium]|nr:alpha-amylase family glycosyl hydrolase [Chloroflexota bacterium]
MFSRQRRSAAALGLVLLVASVGVIPPAAVLAADTSAPSSVTVAGNLQTEIGCSTDWDPACAASHLAYDSNDGVWQNSWTVPAGNWEYKAALNDSWDENYGASAERNGPNILLNLADPASVKFYYSHRTHWITSNRNARIVTAPGNFQSELGCSGDWDPSCLRSWLQDTDGDGTYTFTTGDLPAGTYEAKAAIDESWTENYGAGGVAGGDNISFTVPSDAATVTFSFVSATNLLSISTGDGGGGASHDNDVWWHDLGHNSRDALFRNPGGAVTTGTPVTLRLRAASGDLTAARVRLWNDRTNVQSIVSMTLAADDGTHEWWEATVPASSDPTIYWYRFIAIDGTATAYYEDDSTRTGGWGETTGSSADNSWQLTVYDGTFTTPDWVKNAVIYQIFADRFRDGNPANNPPAGQFFYNEAPTVFRSGGSDWNTPICDPRNGALSTANCPGVYSQNFYGGDLQGIIDKLDYLQDLGVTALYLNPIFESPSNHKYDTTDFTVIDPDFGDQAKFQELASALHGRDMHLILDGVFNHSSSDSIYFDRYGRHDFVGACESEGSPYRDWYYFSPVAPGTGKCVADDGTPAAANYEAWFGFDSLPKLRASNTEVRDFFYAGGGNAIGPYWLTWADGWRLDVAGDVDPGVTNDPGNDYWEGFREAVRAANSDAYIVGEEWGNATPWTLGQEWDATMNYQLSSALLSFYRDEAFVDNDHNNSSSAGVLAPVTPEQFAERVLNLRERYPPEAFAAMMNLLGSHDTNRPLFMLDHNADQNSRALYEDANYDWSDAITRLKGVVVLQGTLPGAPTIYYGDEVGLVAPPTYDGSSWQDDPYNRVPYPWLDETGTPFYSHLQTSTGQAQLLDHYKAVFAARNDHPALRTGDLRFLSAGSGDALVFGRKMADNSDAAVVIVNRAGSAADVGVDVAGYLPAGTQLTSVFDSGAAITVGSDGSLTVPVGARSFGIFVTGGPLAAAPAAVTDVAVTATRASEVDLDWSAATGTDSYDVYRSLLSGGGYHLIANTTSTSFTDSGLDVATTYHYVVVSRDDTSLLTSGYSNEVSTTTGYDLGDAASSWFSLWSPETLSHTISTSARTEPISGRIWIAGVTEAAGAPAGVRAQVGFGPADSQPGASWTWEEMTFDSQHGNDDQYIGWLLPDSTGSFWYATRWSGDGGKTWYLADLQAPERDGTVDNPGVLTVNPAADTDAPGAPTLSLAGTTASSISLSWTAPAADDLAGYELFRDGAKVATLAADATGYVDDTVTTGQSYAYFLKAYDTSFNRSPASNTIEATAENRTVAVTFTVGVPDYTPDSATVYVTGSIAELGPWNPGLHAMTDNGDGTWSRTFNIAEGTSFEWKYTRGSWDTVEQWGTITGLANRGPIVADYGVDGTMLINNTATNWGTGPDGEKAVQDWRDPLVASHSPAADAVDVPLDTTIVVTWSKGMASDSDFSVAGPGGPVAGSFALSNGDRTVTFTPSSPLSHATEYEVSITGERSPGGDIQQVPVSFSFTTVSETTPPTTSDVIVALRLGGQVNANSAPTTVTWNAEDGVSADADLVHQLQRRQRNRSGWSAWTDLGTVTGVESAERDESPLGRQFQYRVRTMDEAGNWSEWSESNVLQISLRQADAFDYSPASWTRVKLRAALGGYVYSSSTVDSTATLSFTGNGVGVVMPTGAGQGTAEVCVDFGTAGEQCTTVDLATFSPSGQRVLVAAFTELDSGAHTLRVRVVAGTVNVDAAVVSE